MNPQWKLRFFILNLSSKAVRVHYLPTCDEERLHVSK